MEEQMKENKMGTMPIGKLMLNMGIPIILSMMLQAVYNIVDSYFVSNMKDTAGMTGVRLWFRNIDFISVTSADISASGGMDFSKGS